MLEQAVVRTVPLGGAYRLRLEDGTEVVAKRHDHESGVLAEAAGLRWLADAVAGTDSAGFRCPLVVTHDAEWLVIDAVPTGSASVAAAESFGRGLAALHRSGAGGFGAPPPGGPADAWIGLAPMRNETGPDWPRWYAEHRILRYLRTAVDQGVLHDHGPIEAVCERIGELAGPAEPPARLHGDLWSGNVLWGADGHVWLIDPAAHGGHRETDLAMLHLFGCPHLERIVAAYDEADPLADGWRVRIALHQLFPLLVHTVLFGGGYGAQAVAAARAALTGL
ncbi:MAG: fructosamine kinase family protein [Actinophytocola sp.]|uniref:fructosamine kinase family protein n=1 Tax=Actinophytocola sp. TaxID=1872138 RepID=UPI003C790D37